MGHAYMELLGNRDEILFQMQAHAAAGDPALREPVRAEFIRLIEDVAAPERRSGRGRDVLHGEGDAAQRRAALELPDEFVGSPPED